MGEASLLEPPRCTQDKIWLYTVTSSMWGWTIGWQRLDSWQQVKNFRADTWCIHTAITLHRILASFFCFSGLWSCLHITVPVSFFDFFQRGLLFPVSIFKFRIIWVLDHGSRWHRPKNQDFRPMTLTMAHQGHGQKWRRKTKFVLESWVLSSFEYGSWWHRPNSRFWSMTLNTTHQGHGKNVAKDKVCPGDQEGLSWVHLTMDLGDTGQKPKFFTHNFHHDQSRSWAKNGAKTKMVLDLTLIISKCKLTEVPESLYDRLNFGHSWILLLSTYMKCTYLQFSRTIKEYLATSMTTHAFANLYYASLFMPLAQCYWYDCIWAAM